MIQNRKNAINKPEHKQRMREIGREVGSRPEVKEKIGNASRARWANPEYYTRVMPKVRAALHKKWQEDAQYRQNVIAGARRASKDPERRRRLSIAIKKYYEDNPQAAEMSSAHMKRKWQDPEFREKTIRTFAESKDNPEYIEKMRQLAYERWQDPEFRDKVKHSMKRK